MKVRHAPLWWSHDIANHATSSWLTRPEVGRGARPRRLVTRHKTSCVISNQTTTQTQFVDRFFWLPMVLYRTFKDREALWHWVDYVPLDYCKNKAINSLGLKKVEMGWTKWSRYFTIIAWDRQSYQLFELFRVYFKYSRVQTLPVDYLGG